MAAAFPRPWQPVRVCHGFWFFLDGIDLIDIIDKIDGIDRIDEKKWKKNGERFGKR